VEIETGGPNRLGIDLVRSVDEFVLGSDRVDDGRIVRLLERPRAIRPYVASSRSVENA